MKTECTSQLTFRNPRVVIGFALYAAGVVLAFGAMNGAAAADSADVELSQSVPAQAPGRWRVTGFLNTARGEHTATLLPNGQVLLAGGFGTSGYLASAELYDPATDVWTATGSMNTAREVHTATSLPNGQVLVAGGLGNSFPLASAELYDPATGMWTATASLGHVRVCHTATLLPNGLVLVSGGESDRHVLARAQLYKSAP